MVGQKEREKKNKEDWYYFPKPSNMKPEAICHTPETESIFDLKAAQERKLKNQ